jgi:lipoate-protein ligase A
MRGDDPNRETGTEWSSFHRDATALEGDDLMARDRRRLTALEANPDLGPSLFLYRWRRPTVSLGYAQRGEKDLDLTALADDGIPVVRRPTGGRAILHVDEWTYSVAAPLGAARLGGNLEDSVRRVAEMVQAALGGLGVESFLAATDAPRRPPAESRAGPACFAQAIGFELTVGGKKLMGSAQRRLTRAYLQQGTILVGAGHERLADYLAGPPETRRRWRLALADSTVTVRQLIGSAADFDAFAKAMETAWAKLTSGRAPGGCSA